MISMIAAMAHNRVIGKDNQMPWHLPADLAHFKKVTTGKPVIMGPKTFDSTGRLLPGRRNIIVSRQAKPALLAADWVHSLEEALSLVADVPEVMVIGGAELYKQALPLASRLYITEIELSTTGDAFFPDYQSSATWALVDSEFYPADDKNPFSCNFKTFERVD